MEFSIISKILGKGQEKADYFLALEILPEKIKAAACEIKKDLPGGGVEILGTAAVDYHGGFEEAIPAADEAISLVEGKLPQEVSLNKVVLGLPTDYIKDDKIEDSYLLKIKQLCQKLALTPLGFVGISPALTHYLEKQRGEGPESLILVRIGQNLEVSLVKVGKITENLAVPAGVDLAQDLEKALVSFKDVEILPSKIILYGGADLEKARQDLMNYPWTSQASFLHFPKIEIAPADLDITAVSFAGASELAKTIETEPSADNFGFVKEKDILETVELEKTKEVEKVEEEKPKLRLPKIKLPSLPELPSLRNFFVGKSKAIAALGVLLTLIILGTVMLTYRYFPTATVTLILEPKTLEQALELNLNPRAAQADKDKAEIPAKTLESESKETRKIASTGKKLVGDPAKGELTIYNLVNNSKVFKKGTILISSNNLKFTLDDEITVASSSTGTDYVKIPGKQNARLTAEKIGPEGNLGVGQEFHFTDYPTDSYVAKNSSAFSGGTSREISVVTRSDQEKLLSLASAELTDQAKKDLRGKLGPDERIIDETIKGTVTGKKFDKEADEEATEVNLDLAMNFSALGYQQDDLLAILEQTIGSSVPNGFEFRKNEVKTETTALSKKKDGTYTLKVNFSASLLPKINAGEIKKNLAGKNLNEVNNYLRTLGNIAGFEIKPGRSLPFSQNSLPPMPQNITLETSSRK